MASLRKRGKIYYVRFRDEHNQQKEQKAGPDKSVAARIQRSIESRLALIRAGCLDPREADAADAERVPLAHHVEEYLTDLQSRCTPAHLVNVRKQLAWFMTETKVTRLSLIRPSLATTALITLRNSGCGDQTCSHYATAWKSFTKWLAKDRRTRTDLLADFETPKVVSSATRKALNPDQLGQLITRVSDLPPRRGISGLDRSWLYHLAAVTGLRRGELQSLTPGSFNLESVPPRVSLPGQDTKNSENAVLPLPRTMTESLSTWLATKTPGKPLWKIVLNTADLIRADLEAAGVPSEGFDFHCLRHSYVSAIVQCGGSVKDSMELARHHDADLTFNRYAHTRLQDLAAIVDRLPDLSAHTCPTVAASSGLNGATPTLENSSPDSTSDAPAGQDDQRPNLNQWLYSPILSV